MLTTVFKAATITLLLSTLFLLISKRELYLTLKDELLTVSPSFSSKIHYVKESKEINRVEQPSVTDSSPPTLDATSSADTFGSTTPPALIKIATYEQLNTTVSDTDESYRPLVSPCEEPLGFKIGVFDTKFGISKQYFIDQIIQSVTIWENEAGKKLFYYDPTAELTINLIYDERQAKTIDVSYLALEIENTKKSATALRNVYEQEKELYTKDLNQLTEDTDRFKVQQDAYTQKVATYNASGGAKRVEYDAMMLELSELKKNAALLDERRLALIEFMKKINIKVAKYNEYVAYSNSLIRQSNTLGAKKFTEGKFTPSTKTIDIYQYNDVIKLKRVLAHEFGHVLGINHNKNKQSIMYSLNDATTTILSKEDIADLADVCAQ